ncbi:SigE family RNA polymerase sigma factor [Actinomadura darangshiensis]|uniref:SigE family RNA polymerase sigma factor n=1 Tax=Actinomadura darangshiensis TaxID=705336 RepID=A0A4R5B4D8_9ACTN|nr:SigE family RNA polymerase sigma factor [Actinomadura darangshiensis]
MTFDDFVTATAGRLLRTAVFLVYDRYLAEDLLQIAYERVARRWRRLADGDPEAYARKVLVNLAIDENRRRTRRPGTPSGSAADLERLAEASSGAPQVPMPARGDLDEVLRALPAKQRAVIVLRYWCDLSEQEIAETLGISRGTVKSHTARAMAALRERMGDEHMREGRA